jgi:hypothetical protein
MVNISLQLLEPHGKALVGEVAAARALNARGGHGAPLRLVVPLFSNRGFVPYLRNLVCSIERVGVRNWFAIAMDNETCPTLGPLAPCTFPYARPLTTTGLAHYRSLEFNRMVMQRPLWIHWLLGEGYTVLNCDLDVVWIHDPLPHLLKLAGPRVDMLYQSEQVYGLNGGWYLARPTNHTISFFTNWLEALAAQTDNRKFEEQHMLNFALKTAAKAGRMHFVRLSESEYPNGKIWIQYRNIANKSTAFIVHMNWVKSNKKTRLRRDNLWFLDPHDTRCHPDFDPFEAGCHRKCVPVSGCRPGEPCHNYSCAQINTIERKEEWHPMAWRHVPECHRIESQLLNHTAAAPPHGGRGNSNITTRRSRSSRG